MKLFTTMGKIEHNLQQSSLGYRYRTLSAYIGEMANLAPLPVQNIEFSGMLRMVVSGTLFSTHLCFKHKNR